MNTTEKRLRAKLPGEDTGITVRHSICDIAAPCINCGLDVYVKDGVVVKVEGTADHPSNRGTLCVRGAATKEYIYRESRLRTPMRRVGPRGSGQLEPITWEQAFTEIAQKLNAIKAKDGPEAVVWYTGYTKWYRPWLQRLTHAFGSRNYCTESSSCNKATLMAWKAVGGQRFTPDMAHCGVYLGWGCNSANNKPNPMKALRRVKERGGKIIIIDPRVTPTSQRMADLHLQLRPGTDGALALGLANVLIEKGWIDRPYIEKYVHGFEEYRALAAQYTLEKTAAITGVPQEQILAAAEMFHANLPAAAYTPGAAVTQHLNGFNNMRAIISLLAITGCLDRVGGGIPVFGLGDTDAGFETMQAQFMYGNMPTNCRERVGVGRFPLWGEFTMESQANDIFRQIREETPYPLKALMAFGMNNRFFLDSGALDDAFEKLELIVATDLVKTDICDYADYVLPVCSSLERSEVKVYSGCRLMCTTPAIEPLYDSKNDCEIICELARYLDLDDDLLKAGYEETMRYMISNLPITLEELREADAPVAMERTLNYTPGSLLEKGLLTPTGKLELYSEAIANLGAAHLDPLPTYRSSFDQADAKVYPFTLIAGARITNGMHSRMHEVPCARCLQPHPTAEIHTSDAQALGIQEGDWVELYTQQAAIRVRAHVTDTVLPGDIYMYHGYKEANVNSLLHRDHIDPYTGFPGYRQARCGLRKADEQ